MGKDVLPDPGPWVAAVERIGILNTILVVLALGFAVSFVFRGPAYVRALTEMLSVILKYRKEKKRIPTKSKNKQINLTTALEARKRNGSGGAK